MSEEPEISKAVGILIEHLKKDSYLRNVWKVCIAEAFYDELPFKDEEVQPGQYIKGAYIHHSRAHEITNKAAERYLNQLCGTHHNEDE